MTCAASPVRIGLSDHGRIYFRHDAGDRDDRSRPDLGGDPAG
ncbi:MULTISPECIES: hypothetical protein [Tabrizicola]|nr:MULTISPECIES: hypothetical protein [Paracoccaceae]